MDGCEGSRVMVEARADVRRRVHEVRAGGLLRDPFRHLSSGTQPAIERRAMRPEHILILAIVAVAVGVVLLALDRNDQEH